MYYYIFGAIGVGLLLWIGGSYLVVRKIEEPAYTVLQTRDGYEIREYAPYIVAKTTVKGSYQDATSQGFRIIADYIFGNNSSKESIAMTVPVLEGQQVNESEKNAMTVPVLEKSENEKRVIAFVLPSKYTLATLPVPKNPQVELTEVPKRKVAVLQFTWYATEARMESKKKLLQGYLMRDQQIIVGEVKTARYNPPLSMPLMLRNEVLIPIE